MKTFVSLLAIGLTSTALLSYAAESSDITAKSVQNAILTLGHKATRHTDAGDDPHFVLTSNVDGVKEIAVFFDDCRDDGICEDVTWYANYGVVSVSDARLNAWNHINSKTRSKAFRSRDGSIGLSYTMSYLHLQDQETTAMLSGLFLLESEIFGAALALDE